MPPDHPLARPPVVREIETAVSAHLGRPWTVDGFTDLGDRASHPCGLLHGDSFTVFAKLGTEGGAQFTAEVRGLDLIRRRAGVLTPVPVAGGVLPLGPGAVLLLEAIPEILPAARTAAQWRSIGRSLATLHQARADRFGLAEFDGFFGPLPQDNAPVEANRWPEFYARRRLAPRLRSAVDGGHLPPELAAGVDRLIERLPQLAGPEPVPSLLHGDAQQNNFLTCANGPVLLDAAPHYGHPEVDLALVDYFAPVPAELFEGYREVQAIDPGFPERRELWRLFAYLAVVTVDGTSAFGRLFIRRIAEAVARYG